jgi:hypothetical protein
LSREKSPLAFATIIVTQFYVWRQNMELESNGVVNGKSACLVGLGAADPRTGRKKPLVFAK